MHDTPPLNRLLAVSGTVILLGTACMLGFFLSSTMTVTGGPAHSSIDLVVQVGGIFGLVFFFVVSVTSSAHRAMGIACDGSQAVESVPHR